MKKKKLKKQLKIWQNAYIDVFAMSVKKDEDIRTLVFEPESNRAKEIRSVIILNREFANMNMFGEFRPVSGESCNGILDAIKIHDKPEEEQNPNIPIPY